MRMRLRQLGCAAAALFALGVSAAASAQCPDRDAARNLSLDVDWESLAPGYDAWSGRFFAEASSPARSIDEPDCLLVAELDPTVVILESPEPTLDPLRPSVESRELTPPPIPATQSEPWTADSARPSLLRHFTFHVRMGGVYENNIDHEEEDPLESWGGVLGAGMRFETDDFELQYEVASHAYTHTNRWTRISHSVEAEVEQDISDKVEFEATAETGMRGSGTDDRDLGNDSTLEPGFNFELTDTRSLRLYGAYRLRRYGEGDPLRDADNHYAGLELEQGLGAAELEVGARWERNHSEGLRNRYERQTFEVEYTTPFRSERGELAFEMKVRPQRYAHRFIDDEVEEGLRRDIRWIFEAATGFRIFRNVSMHTSYRFEMRTSNDPEQEWDAHQAKLGFRYTFGGNRRVEADPGDGSIRRDR